MADRPPFGFGPPGRPGDDDPQPSGRRGAIGPAGAVRLRLRPRRPWRPWRPVAIRTSSRTRCASSPTCSPTAAGRSTGSWRRTWPGTRSPAKGDPSVLANERAAVTEAVRLADLWLDDVTTFPSGIRKIEAWSKSEWLEATFPVWSTLCEPIAAKGGRRDGLDDGLRPLAARTRTCPRRCGPCCRGWAGCQRARAHDAAARRGDARRPDRHRDRRAGRRDGQLHRHRPAARPRRGPRRCCRLAWPRSARAFRSTSARCGCSSRCARRRTTGCSGTCRGCASTCSARSRRTRPASPWT